MRAFVRLLPVLFAACAASAAVAGTGYYLVPVYENEGQVSLDLRWWQARPPGASPVGSPAYGIGWGVTRAWYSEVYVSYINRAPAGLRPRDTSWQNDFLLTQGQWPIDLALHTSVHIMRDRSRGTELEIGPVMETEFGRTHVNAGLLLERAYRSERPASTQMKYQWAVRHRFHPLLQLGVMGFGELGDWDDWLPRAQQSHRAGPALWGRWDMGGGRTLKYEAAWLVGKISGVHTNALTSRVQVLF